MCWTKEGMERASLHLEHLPRPFLQLTRPANLAGALNTETSWHIRCGCIPAIHGGGSTECVSYTVKFSKRLDSTLHFCASSSYLRSRIRTYSGRPRRWLASIAYGRPVYRYSDDLRCCMRIELWFAATTTHIYFAYSVFEQASFINFGFQKSQKDPGPGRCWHPPNIYLPFRVRPNVFIIKDDGVHECGWNERSCWKDPCLDRSKVNHTCGAVQTGSNLASMQKSSVTFGTSWKKNGMTAI